ncbi:MAG TPA: hypothetical protein VMF57_22305 [Solirubrobacteraceae bacterium]|nr:hypothetical protein [Solirubrobacteraceae bacterium]
MKLLVGLPVLLATLAHGAAPSQDRRLQLACTETAESVQSIVVHATSYQDVVIGTRFRAVVPGVLTGRIAFNSSGSTIHVAGDKSSSEGFGCAAGAVGPGVPNGHGHSQVVSTLHRRFTAPGTYMLRFDLNRFGLRTLARLGAADQAYRTRHPHGRRPPSIAFGVSLSYTPAG